MSTDDYEKMFNGDNQASTQHEHVGKASCLYDQPDDINVEIEFDNSEDEGKATKKCYQKQWPQNFFLFMFGICTTMASQVLFYEIGIITLPEAQTSLSSPHCYACVNIANLDGTYQNYLDRTEFKVKTTQIFHGASSTVDTIVEVVKDPAEFFTPCECNGQAFRLSELNCTIQYVFDECVHNCLNKNGITGDIMIYNPKKDQIQSSVTITPYQVDEIATFMRIDADDDGGNVSTRNTAVISKPLVFVD